MPGHKGRDGLLSVEHLDLTEIDGADELFRAEGIIRESERNAGELFGADTFYSAEGSSLAIRTMLLLAVKWAYRQGLADEEHRPVILAGRNAHKVLIHTSALLDFDTQWIYPKEDAAYQTCAVTGEDLLAALDTGIRPVALYVTSPDYLGNLTDLKPLAEICHSRGILLLTDNAHGAYLKFLDPSLHPMDCGADMCADSAHKTMPVLTGGAYLHLSRRLDDFFKEEAREAMEVFASSSPSYLILESLDLNNPYMERLPALLRDFLPKVGRLREELLDAGFRLTGDEKLKITIEAFRRGYTGDELAGILREAGIFSEYHDHDYLVLMLTPQNTDEELRRFGDTLRGIEPRPEIAPDDCTVKRPERVMSPRRALLTPTETVTKEESTGRVFASASVSCPPAVPVCMLGEAVPDGKMLPGNGEVKVVKAPEL